MKRAAPAGLRQQALTSRRNCHVSRIQSGLERQEIEWANPAQQRQVEAHWQSLCLEAPAHQRKFHGASAPVEINVIMVREPTPPMGQPSLEWVLPTTLGAEDARQAGQIVRRHSLRWQIEIMHRDLEERLPGGRTAFVGRHRSLTPRSCSTCCAPSHS